MQGNVIRASIMPRSMILIYFSCLVLSLAPAIIAPPEREFARGQPELHQAMDNMVTYKNIISKRIDSDTELDHREKLTSNTANLLSETERILSSLPATKERQWFESFVERMRAIAIMLEKTTPQNKMQHLPEVLKSANLTRIPEVLSIQPTWPTFSAVRETNSFQKSNRLTSKSPVTSPEFSDVLPSNEYSTERHSVTKPVVLLNENDEDEDELAKELNSLHQLFAPQNSKTLDQIPVVTTSSPQVSPQSHDKKAMNIEEERERIKSQLIKELAEFQSLGGKISSDLFDELKIENKKTAGFTNSPKQVTEINSYGAQKNDEFEAQKQNDFKIENKKYSVQNFPNMHLEKNEPHEAEKLLQQLNISHAFHNNNPYFNHHIHPFPNEMAKNAPYKSPQSKEIPYEASFQNARHNLLKPKTFNNKEHYQSFLHSSNKQSGHIPEAVKQMLSRPKNQVHDGYLTAHNYNEFLMSLGYGPYPYKHSQDHKISTHYPSSKMFSPHPKQPVNHQMDAELSDEMKRQLRDGKIIVLSDSVVRSNFEPCKDNLDNETKKEKPQSENVEKKNDSKISK